MEISVEAKKKYIERRKENLAALEQALQTKDFEVWKTIGHQLKGNARTFGFVELEPVAVQIEKVAIDQSWDQAESLISEFRLWLEKQAI